jgi:hypothetical protein
VYTIPPKYSRHCSNKRYGYIHDSLLPRLMKKLF